MVDSGAPLHMIGKYSLKAEEKKSIRPTPYTHYIQTANGIIEVNKECRIYTSKLDLWIWAKLAGEDSPAVLSLGRICYDLGYSYVWSAGEQPRLIKGLVNIIKSPNAAEITCPIENCVPLIVVVSFPSYFRGASRRGTKWCR